MRTAYFSPMPPSRSGIADYSALLVPALRERTGVEVVKQGSRRHPRGTDLALYHVGNDPEAHGWILEALRARPGVAVLHEWVLHHLIAGLTLGRKDVAQYLESQPEVGDMVTQIETFIARWLPAFVRDQRSYLTVAIGCTGGQHRSVYFAEVLAQRFRGRSATLIRHRELDRLT